MKGETEAKNDAKLDRGARNRVIPLGGADLVTFRQSPDTQRKRRSAAVSLISSAANVHDISEAAKAL